MVWGMKCWDGRSRQRPCRYFGFSFGQELGLEEKEVAVLGPLANLMFEASYLTSHTRRVGVLSPVISHIRVVSP